MSAGMKMAKRKSEVRKKRAVVSIRVDPIEKLEIQDSASAEGLTVGSYIRKKILVRKITKKRTAPSLDKVLLSNLIGQISTIGSEIKIITARLNDNKEVSADKIKHLITTHDKLSILLDEAFKVIRVS